MKHDGGDGPLVDSKQKQPGPGSYAGPYQDTLHVNPPQGIHPITLARVRRARCIQLFLRAFTLLDALALFFCSMCIKQTNLDIRWFLRLGPYLATTVSSANYMIFAAIVDASMAPCIMFSTYVSYLDYILDPWGWDTLFHSEAVTQQIITAFFLLNIGLASALILSLPLDGFLAPVLCEISMVRPSPPDLQAET
ncbi:hypothetical protein DV735_g3757, partial [Chaetothyriales sp. CBS 134920]